MRLFKYNNINCNFTIESLSPYIEAFWIKKVIMSNFSKIWITLIVSDSTKSIVVIENIPFNTCDYADLVIVLKQYIDSKLYNIVNVKDITFKFYMEKPIISLNFKYFDILFIWWIFILLIILILVLLIPETLIMGDMNVCDDNFLKIEEISFRNDKSLNPFIEIFSKDSSYHYYPSYFLQSNRMSYDNDFNLVDHILHHQYHLFNIHKTMTNKYMEGIHDIIVEYYNIMSKYY